MSASTANMKTISANGVEFHYFELGTGPLALCLHGFPDTAHSWLPVMKHIASAGFRAVAPNMRGYAPTSVPADGFYQTAALSLDAVALHEVAQLCHGTEAQPSPAAEHLRRDAEPLRVLAQGRRLDPCIVQCRDDGVRLGCREMTGQREDPALRPVQSRAVAQVQHADRAPGGGPHGSRPSAPPPIQTARLMSAHSVTP